MPSVDASYPPVPVLKFQKKETNKFTAVATLLRATEKLSSPWSPTVAQKAADAARRILPGM